jgi:hypothetical protein
MLIAQVVAAEAGWPPRSMTTLPCCGSALAQLPPLGRRQLLVRTDSRGASVSVLWWLHDRHWKQFNHPEALGSRHGRRGALATDPWPLADHTKSVSGSLALHNSTRDEPVNLSGSRLRTHQHWSPADANCCQSLLLDPDATISIDLHKRLFLLVTGRGE